MTERDMLLLAQARQALADGSAEQLRVGHRLRRVEVARSADISPVTLAHWEKGRRAPRGAPALRYARVLERLRSAEAATAKRSA